LSAAPTQCVLYLACSTSLRKHPVKDVESACALALTAGTTRLRFVRTFLTAVTPPQLTDKHRLIAPIDTYTTHLETLMQGELPLD
jgi:hypothetical protein